MPTIPSAVMKAVNEIFEREANPTQKRKLVRGKQTKQNGTANGHGFSPQKTAVSARLQSKETYSENGISENGISENGISEAGKYVSEEEYMRVYAEHPDFNYEWNNGILEEKPVSNLAQLKLYRWLLQILSYYLEVNHLAEAVMFEFLTEMKVGDKLVKRKPDLVIVRNDNPNPLHERDNSYAGVFDLCVELLSTSNQANIDRDIKVKKAEYATVGVREYLILDIDDDHMEFYRLSALGEYETVQPDAQGVVSFESLPGFQFRWDDLLIRPPLRTLVEDSVYNHYILPEYEILKRHAEHESQRAAQESKRAEQEAQRAEQEAQRAQEAEERAAKAQRIAERYAARIRALGGDPEAMLE